MKIMTALENEIIAAIYAAVPLDIDKSEITAETSFESLGITSMETITVLFEFEEKFGIDIETEEMFTLSTLRSISEFIQNKISSQMA